MARETMRTGWLAQAKEVSGGAVVRDALTEGEMDYEVSLHNVSTRIYEGGKEIRRTVPDNFAVVRMDNYLPLAVVGKNYTPIQHASAFGVVDVLVAEGQIQITHAYSIRNGRKVMLVTSVPEGFEIAGEPYDFHLAFFNGHDGKTPVKLVPIPTRIYCTNALPGLFSKAASAFTIKHTKTAPLRLIEAQQQALGTDNLEAELRELTRAERDLKFEAQKGMRVANRYADNLKAVGEELAAQKMNDRQFDNFLSKLVPIDREEDPIRQVNMREEKRSEMRLIWRQEDNLNNIRGTRWAALQVTAQWSDHLRSHTSGYDAKLMSIVEGKNDKQQALALLS
jgi:hypothetical protein